MTPQQAATAIQARLEAGQLTLRLTRLRRADGVRSVAIAIRAWALSARGSDGDGRLTVAGAVPAAGADAVHAVRGAADRRGRLVFSFFNWNGFGTADQLGRLRQLPLRARNAGVLAGAAQQRPDHRRLAADPAAAGAWRLPCSRRALPRRGRVAHAVLPALYPGRNRRRPDLRFVYDGDYGLVASIWRLFGARRRICSRARRRRCWRC